MVNSPKGTIFFKSIEAFDICKIVGEKTLTIQTVVIEVVVVKHKLGAL